MKKLNKMYVKMMSNLMHCKQKLLENDGQFAMDHAAVFVLILAVAAVALTLLIAFLKNGLAPALQTKIMELFNLS